MFLFFALKETPPWWFCVYAEKLRMCGLCYLFTLFISLYPISYLYTTELRNSAFHLKGYNVQAEFINHRDTLLLLFDYYLDILIFL